MTIGERLREERERLGLSQPAFATAAGTTKQTVFSWETGKTAPDGFQLAAVSACGVDVLYVLTGERAARLPAMNAAERLLVENYRQCSDEGRAHLLQTSTLLMAGLAKSPKTPARAKRETAPVPGSVNMAGMTMTNSTPGGVQVGYVGGKVSIKKGR